MMTAPRPEPPTACVILAAGGSRRLGEPKQLVKVDDRPLLERVVLEALAVPELWPIVVVVGGNQPAVRPLLRRHPVLVVENPAWEEGVASSLRAGLAAAVAFSRQIAAVMFTLCDQPALSASLFAQLLATRRDEGRAVVAARYQGRPGAPALIGRRYFEALAHLTGDQGARQLLHGLPATEIALVDCPALEFDIDTPADLARVRAPNATGTNSDRDSQPPA